MINKKSNAKLPQNKKVGGVPRKDWKKVTDQDVELGRQKATKTGEYGVYGRAGINAPDYTGVSSDKVALYEHNRKVNKFAMETGVTPNYDSIQNKREPKGRDGMTYEVGEAMKNFYKSPDAAGKMKQAEKDFIKTQPAGYKKPSLDQARVAGGSRPMHQASTIQIDPMTGLPLQANAPAMGNFGGAMGMSNVPMYDQSMSPGAIAQSRAYKTFQTDSTAFDAGLKGESGPMNYIKNKYPINFNAPVSEQDPKSMKFYKDFKEGYSDKTSSKEDLNQERKNYSKEILTRPMTSEQLKNYESAVTSYKDSSNAWIKNQGPEPKIPDYTSFKLTPAEKAGKAAGKFGLKAIGKPKS